MNDMSDIPKGIVVAMWAISFVFLWALFVSVVFGPVAEKEVNSITESCQQFSAFCVDGERYECTQTVQGETGQ